MLSRVAESVYWMSRYIERAENVARFIDVKLHMILDMPDIAEQTQWEALVTTSGDEEAFAARYDKANQSNVTHFLTFDLENPNSIASCLRAARENARNVRDVISSEMWEQVNRFHLMVSAAAKSGEAMHSPHDFYTQVKMASHLFVGITDTTMSHGEGWHFARLGRSLERSDKTSRIVDVKYYILLPQVEYVGMPLDNLQWAALLKSASALEMYRKQYRRIVPAKVAEFLILDPQFPRAIRYCLAKAQQSLHAISGSPMGTFQNEPEQQIGRLRAQLDYARIEEIMSGGLHEYLDNVQAQLNRTGDAIFETFFALRPLEAGTKRSA